MLVNLTITHHQKIHLIMEYIFHSNRKDKLTKKSFLRFAKGTLANRGMNAFDGSHLGAAQWSDEAEELNRKWFKNDQFCGL